MTDMNLVEKLKNMDPQERDNFLKEYIMTADSVGELTDVILAYPHVLSYAYAKGDEFFIDFLQKKSGVYYLEDAEINEYIGKIVDVNAIILNPEVVKFYLSIPIVRDKLFEARPTEIYNAIKATPLFFFDKPVHKFVINYVLNDPNYVLEHKVNDADPIFDGEEVAKAKIQASLKNDLFATLAYYSEYKYLCEGLLTNDIIKPYFENNKDFVLTEDNIFAASDCDYLLELSFKNNYEETMQIMLRHLYGLKKVSASRLQEMIGDKFVVNGDNHKFIEYWPSLLESSMNNDAKATLNHLANRYSYHYIKEELKEEYTRILRPYLEKSHFVIDEDTVGIYIISEEFIDLSFKNDPSQTLKVLAKARYIPEVKKILEGRDIVSILLNDKDFVLNEGIVRNFSQFIPKEGMQKLIEASMKNDPLNTILLSGDIASYLDDKMKATFKDFLLNQVDMLSGNYECSMSLAKLFSQHPDILEEIFNNDPKKALQILQVCRVQKLSEQAQNIIKEKLTNTGYVLGYKDNNPYLANLMFEESLKNDFKKTMEFGIEGFYDKTTFINDALKNNPEGLREIISKGISSNDIVFNGFVVGFINQDNQILVDALKNDYSRTIENLKSIGTNKIFLTDETSKKEVYKILRDNKFTCGDSLSYLQAAPIFIIASLKNDYQGTRDVIMRKGYPLVEMKFTDDEYEMIMDIIADNGDRELYAHMVAKYSDFFIRLLENDPIRALELFDKNLKNPHSLFNTNNAKKIVDKLIEIDKTTPIDLSKYPKLTAALSWGTFLNQNEDTPQIEFMKTHGMNPALIPFQTVEDIKPYLSKQELELYEKIYFDESYVYQKEDEEKLLTLMGSKFGTLEDELANMHRNGISRKNMTLIQCLAIALFAKKDLKKKGIPEYKVSVFEYSGSRNTLGTCYPTSCKLKIYNGNDASIYGVISTTIHENNHARQNVDVSNCDVASDEDIIVYSRDKFLRKVLSEIYKYDYYEENYWSTSMEFDTEEKAQMETLRILRIEDKVGDLGENGIVDPIELAKFGDKRNKYDLTGKRMFDGKEYYLDDLFELGLNEAIKRGFFDPSTIKRTYPSIEYEYDLDVYPVKRYSIEEIMEKYLKADEFDRDIYKAILRHRINPLYNKNHKEDLDELCKFIKNHKEEVGDLGEYIYKTYAVLTGEKVSEIDQLNMALKKYLSIAENILESDKRISREEFEKIIRK